MAQTVSQPAVYANGLIYLNFMMLHGPANVKCIQELSW